MIQKTYTKNYVFIYVWQGLAVILNLISLFIVIPAISRFPEIYGIYSICISVALFLQYSDLGFMSAGYKYASEYFAQNNRIGEIRIIGFVTFILLIFVGIYFGAILFLSFYPRFLISGLNYSGAAIASKLLLIQAFSSIIIILRRCLQVIYGIRLEDYIYQRVLIGGSILKIISVFYFFNSNNYRIVDYYLFVQIINFSGLVAGIWIAYRRYQYDFLLVFKSIRFSTKVYNKTKKLAFSAFLLTISWVLYYELDTFVIAKLSGASAVGFYAIGFTMLSFFRSSFGILFNPFNARFNHFIGLKDNVGLRQFYLHVMRITLPLVVIPILTLYMLAPSFILSWVGEGYSYSIGVARILILSNVLAFITYPTSGIVIAQHKVKLLNLVSFSYPIIFWIGIFFTYRYLDIMSFAIFKLVAFIVSGIIYLFFAMDFLKIDFITFFKKILLPIAPSLIFIVIVLWRIEPYLPVDKSKLNVIITVIVGCLAGVISIGLYAIFSKRFKEYIISVAKLFLSKQLSG
jgi:O-antigen/teichoic acid export membrane protein